LVSLKVLDADGNGKWSYLIRALNQVSRNYIEGDVVNLSLGAYCVDCAVELPGLRTMILNLAAKKVYIVMASGNDAGDAKRNFPGCINSPVGSPNYIFTVGAIDCDGLCTFYSNYGAPPIDYVAVGTHVFSTFIKDPLTGQWQYTLMSGTSMSTAVISGVIHATSGAIKAQNSTCGSPPYSKGRTRM